MSSLLFSQEGRIATLTINRPTVLNALNVDVMKRFVAALEKIDRDPGIGCVIVTGSERAFAAGADIRDFVDRNYPDAAVENFLADWDHVARTRKPMIAAVSGYALGGGCELAMLCDMIIASETAQFGQPEIKLGLIPGMGGTQRLARAVGKAKATDLLLTGRMMPADEAERCGLVARVVPAGDVVRTARETAETIASYGTSTVLTLKAALRSAFEGSLSEGLAFERLGFHACFATAEKREGVSAFLQKRQAQFHSPDGDLM